MFALDKLYRLHWTLKMNTNSELKPVAIYGTINHGIGVYDFIWVLAVIVYV